MHGIVSDAAVCPSDRVCLQHGVSYSEEKMGGDRSGSVFWCFSFSYCDGSLYHKGYPVYGSVFAVFLTAAGEKSVFY